MEQAKARLASLVSVPTSFTPHRNGATRAEVKAFATLVKAALRDANRRCLVFLAGAYRRGVSHSHKIVLCVQMEPLHALSSAKTREEATREAEAALRRINEALAPLLQELRHAPEDGEAAQSEELYMLESGAVVEIELQ